MTIEWLRDLIIVIFGIVATLVFIALAVIMFVIYRRVDKILAKVQRAIDYAEKQLIRPSMAIIASIRNGMYMVSSFFRRKRRARRPT